MIRVTFPEEMKGATAMTIPAPDYDSSSDDDDLSFSDSFIKINILYLLKYEEPEPWFWNQLHFWFSVTRFYPDSLNFPYTNLTGAVCLTVKIYEELIPFSTREYPVQGTGTVFMFKLLDFFSSTMNWYFALLQFWISCLLICFQYYEHGFFFLLNYTVLWTVVIFKLNLVKTTWTILNYDKKTNETKLSFVLWTFCVIDKRE